MRIAIPDDYQSCITSLKAFDILKGHRITVVNTYEQDPQTLAKKMNDPEALVLTRTRTRVDDNLLQYLPNLKVISQTGKNPGHIDVEACKKRGVTILEGKGDPTATAELTWALIINALRMLPQSIRGMQEGHWQTNLGRRVKGTLIGIWGYGRIGKKIAEYARVFGASVMVWGSTASREKAVADGYQATESKEAFFSSCDVVSLHLRLKPETKHLVKLEDLKLMKEDAILVNTARAGLIEPKALLTALQAGRPGFAAIDVYDQEPIFNADHPLLQLPQVICTPHLGYVERESYELYFGIAFQNLVDFIESGRGE